MLTWRRGEAAWPFTFTFMLALLAAVVVVVVAALGSQPPPAVADALSPEWNREFGVLEGMQTGLLLGIALILLRDPRLVCRLAGIATVFLFLEELDYFLHLWDWVVHGDVWRTDIYGVRNLHNEPWAQNYSSVGYAVLTLCLLAIATWRLAFPSTEARIVPLRRPAAGVIACMGIALSVSAMLGRLYADVERQFFNETHELALYASAALIVCEMHAGSEEPRRQSGGEFEAASNDEQSSW